MDSSSCPPYKSPGDHSALSFDGTYRDGAPFEGTLTSESGQHYLYSNGIPNLIFPRDLCEIEARTMDSYDRIAGDRYEAAMNWQFAATKEDENTVRELMIDLLDLEAHHRVLEVGCGTGRDSFRIARRLGPRGVFFAQDLSPQMVLHCRQTMVDHAATNPIACQLRYFVSNASYLPFDDGEFDAVFHFGGFNEFGDGKRAAKEFARVTKRGGRIVFGDESVAPWLRGTEFEQIVVTNNPLFSHEVPLSVLPDCSRNVSVRWMIANCFYLIAFTKGDGPPDLDLDLPHAGRRGGTMRTRYFGQLEGVTPETKRIALEAAALSGLSIHEWLDALVLREAQNALGEKAGENPGSEVPPPR